MPRDLPLGNGSLLVSFDLTDQIREVYWPTVGLENHAMGHVFRVGVWADGLFHWLGDPGWERDLRYRAGTLLTQVRLSHADLNLTLDFTDAVDFHENLLVRHCTITDTSGCDRDVRLFFHHDFRIAGNEVGDTAYYEPDRHAVIHYKGPRWFLINGAVALPSHRSDSNLRPTTDTFPGLLVGIHQWACGHKEVGGREGTWRDAEDGQLSGNPIAQGSVDSTVAFEVHVPSGSSSELYCWMAVGPDFKAVTTINRLVRQRGPQRFLDRTSNYWQLWLDVHRPDLSRLPAEIARHYETSLLIVRTQTDSGGAVVAANDSDVGSDVRDTYSYIWPRDGALVADAFAQAGYVDLPRNFFNFCAKALTAEGYLLHKYSPDGTLASSWHPWFHNGAKELPIQEDETALVLWALWRYFARFGDVEFVKPLYRPLVIAAANFLTRYRDLESGLPLPSYDLWEERRGVSPFTIGAVWAGLIAGANFATAFGENENATRYREAAERLRSATDRLLWQEDEGRFARLANKRPDGSWDLDLTVDSSVAGLWRFGMYAPDDSRIVRTMTAVRDWLWVKSDVGGIARYANDSYRQTIFDDPKVPGNPWFVTTLWLAEWEAEVARTPEDLSAVLNLLHWATDKALPSGVLAEQIHPYTGSPLSVSPLTWSHAGLVSAVQSYLCAETRVNGESHPTSMLTKAGLHGNYRNVSLDGASSRTSAPSLGAERAS